MTTANNVVWRTRLRISIAGKNVSTNLAPYITVFTFNDKTSNEVDDISFTLEDRENDDADESGDLFINSWFPTRGDEVEVAILTYHREGLDDAEELDCGTFEIDLVSHSAPPNLFSIHAVSNFNSSIRREIHNHKWEKTTLFNICQSIAQGNGLKLVFEGEDEDISSVDQTDQTDLQFLAKLAEDNDFMIKLTTETLFIVSQVQLESAAPVMQISRFDMKSCSAAAQAFDLYKEAVARYWSPKTNKLHHAKVSHGDVSKEQVAKINSEYAREHQKTTAHRPSNNNKPHKNEKLVTEHYLDKANIYGGGKTLNIRQRFDNAAEAAKVASSRLKQKNRGEWRMEGTLPGNPFLMAGVTVDVVDYGVYSGRYYIESTTHSVNKGYTTSFTAHRVLGEVES